MTLDGGWYRGGVAKTTPPYVIAPALKKSPGGIFGYHFILLQHLTGLIGFNNLYYLSFLLSKDFRLALWALLSAVEVLMNSVNSKQNMTIIQQILNERRQ